MPEITNVKEIINDETNNEDSNKEIDEKETQSSNNKKDDDNKNTKKELKEKKKKILKKDVKNIEQSDQIGESFETSTLKSTFNSEKIGKERSETIMSSMHGTDSQPTHSNVDQFQIIDLADAVSVERMPGEEIKKSFFRKSNKKLWVGAASCATVVSVLMIILGLQFLLPNGIF